MPRREAQLMPKKATAPTYPLAPELMYLNQLEGQNPYSQYLDLRAITSPQQQERLPEFMPYEENERGLRSAPNAAAFYVPSANSVYLRENMPGPGYGVPGTGTSYYHEVAHAMQPRESYGGTEHMDPLHKNFPQLFWLYYGIPKEKFYEPEASYMANAFQSFVGSQDPANIYTREDFNKSVSEMKGITALMNEMGKMKTKKDFYIKTPVKEGRHKGTTRVEVNPKYKQRWDDLYKQTFPVVHNYLSIYTTPYSYKTLQQPNVQRGDMEKYGSFRAKSSRILDMLGLSGLMSNVRFPWE